MSIELKIGVMPGQINTFATNAGGTVADALELAGLSADGYTIRYNGTDVSASTVVEESGTILLVKQIKGNK